MDPSLPPCPHCQAAPVAGQTEGGFHYLECGKLIDCPEWPTTEPLPTPEEARAAWIAMFPAAPPEN